MEQPYFVYILRCADNTLYTGITNDLSRRVRMHNDGTGAKYTRGRGPVRLAYYEACGTRAEASRREYAIKRMPREEKLRLMQAEDANIKNGEERPKDVPRSGIHTV